MKSLYARFDKDEDRQTVRQSMIKISSLGSIKAIREFFLRSRKSQKRNIIQKETLQREKLIERESEIFQRESRERNNFGKRKREGREKIFLSHFVPSFLFILFLLPFFFLFLFFSVTSSLLMEQETNPFPFYLGIEELLPYDGGGRGCKSG